MKRALRLAIALCLTPAVARAAPSAPAKRTARPCGTIDAAGCCAGTTLHYCERGKLMTLDCRTRPLCGWQDRGRYDCDTAGNADPSGKHAKQCPPAVTPTPGERDCGPITARGCCDGSVLRYCDAKGRLRAIDCGRNPNCGFRGVGQIYNCGTDGKPDPRGKHAIRCPAHPAPAPPAGRPHFVGRAPTSGAAAREPKQAPAAERPAPAGTRPSSCVVGDGAPAGPGLGAGALLLLVLVHRLTTRGRR